MKVISLILLTYLGVINMMAQGNNDVCGEILYKQSTNFSRYFERDFLMSFTAKYSYSEEYNYKASDDAPKQKDDDEGRIIYRNITNETDDPDYFLNIIDEFYFQEIYFNQPLLVKEVENMWNWELQNETKKIGSFLCSKATISFRGRNYTAWFTNDIPVPFGPWKFQGLSGLILEVYDDDNVFHITAKNIKLNKKDDCSIAIDTNSLNKAMTIEEYLEEKKKLLREDFAKISSRMPKGYGNLKLDEDCDDCREEIEKFEKN